MGKIIRYLTIILACTVLAVQAFAQSSNPNCTGLKNPQNFTLAGGTANAQWSGKTGTKPSGNSTCNAPAANLSTVVAAANLESQTSGSCYSVTTYDIHNNEDHAHRFCIKGNGYDPYTGNNLSYLPPDTSFHSSIRLGNFCWNAEAEGLTYEFTVNSYNMLVTIWYALSLENALHSSSQNPEFSITVKKQVGNNWVLAAGDTLCYIQATPASGQSIAPFLQGASSPGSGNLYLPWTKVMINLSKLQYQRVRIELVSSDCSAGGHYASSYFAGDCQQIALKANGCAAGESDAVARIAAPKGANGYAWYRSKYGKLNGADIDNLNNYDLIPGATDSILNVTINQFINYTNPSHPDTMNLNSFLCRMTTYMNPSYPVVSTITTDVGNTKPTIIVDSTLGCNAEITLRDISVTPYAPDEQDQVDTNNTVWKFYSSTQPTPQTLVATETGGTVSHTFTQGGNYCVRVRTSAYDTSCWNEKTVAIRTIKAPEASFRIERDSLCEGDTIFVFNTTPGAAYNEWTVIGRVGDTTHIVTPTSATRFRFDTTSTVILRTRNNVHYNADTNLDGFLEPVYCYTTTQTTVHVNAYPVITVTGDTIVCNGTQAVVNVSSQSDENRYDWFTSMHSSNPLQSNTSTLTTTPSHDQRYYVKAYSPFGCQSWDSINIYIVDPHLDVPVTEVCDNTSVALYASNAYSYTWTSMPDDPSMVGQETNDTLIVTPHQNTTYILTGHGMNNCSTTPLTQTIKVFPYPVPTFDMKPKFIDSEEPVVTFRDVSPGATTSLWNFGNGNTSNERQIRYTFTDLSEDSIQITLTTGNVLGCTSDTSFYIPVELFAVWFPNVFTPMESTNRTFKTFTHNQLEFYSLYIYDRRGALVFHSYDQNEEWDGKHNGQYCQQGVYVVVCTYRRPGTSDIVTTRTTVTLLL